MRMITCIALALAACPGAAQACSMIPDSRMTPAQRDQNLREWVRRSDLMIEVVAEAGSDMSTRRPGMVRVVRVYKGDVRVGTRFPVYGQAPAICGAGDVRAGQRGVLMIYRLAIRTDFEGFVRPDQLARLRQLGLIR